MDGNGVPAPANITTYAAAFPNRITATNTPMGCPAACDGYELAQNLDFAADGMAVTSTDAYPNWTPIGGTYTAIFDGDGYAISNLTMNRGGNAALFNTVGNGGVIRNLGLVSPSMSGLSSAINLAPLAGNILSGGQVNACYVQGGAVTATGNTFTGGLVGNNSGTIRASYATAAISGGTTIGSNGGLAGSNTGGGAIIASYAAGAMSGNAPRGGFVGTVQGSSSITDSYCDSTVNGTSTPCVATGASIANATQKTTAELQTPTGYTGIYANWNIDLDGDTFPDNPWHFGAISAYPTITDPKTSEPPAANQRTIDHDPDDDNLIDVDTLQKLNAIRHDLNGDGLPASTGTYAAYAGAFPVGNFVTTTPNTPRMGCPATCIGYELTANLNFDADGMGGVTSTDPYPNWTPIGGSYAAVFDGKGYTISNLTIAGATGNSGLFDTLGNGGVIRDVGMLAASISNNGADANVGVLAGDNDGGMILTSYALAGAVTITGTSTYGGGLLGRNAGDVRAVYSTVSVTAGGAATSTIGGLIGRHAGSITASYAAGRVTGTAAAIVGGFAGAASSTAAAITASYCNTTVNGTSTPCVGAHTAGATATSTGYTTSQLQTPTGYTGIYANWNLSVDGDAFPDNPWNFGTSTTYPALYTPTQRQTAVIDYDADNDNLIDVATLHQLNAIRYDLNGNGVPDAAANTTTYAAVFPSGNIADTSTPYMGCATTCTGYELTANINFAADRVAVTSTDPYPNWTPIGGSYAAVFDGKGFTISNLTITGATGNSGLFDTLTTGAVIRDVGMVSASIGNDGADAYVGVLAGDNDGGSIITSYALGGAVTVTGTSTYGGGLIGRNAGDLRAVYSTTAVNASSMATTTAASPTVGGLIGLHAGTVTASYAAGAVTGTAAAIVGGFAGQASSTAATITNGYCDTDATGQSACIGAHTAGATATSTGYTTTQLQTPTGYTGIYQSWNIPLGADTMRDDPWDFRTNSQYPTIKPLASRTRTAPPPPPIPPPPPEPTPTPTSTPATSTDPVPGDGGNGGNGGNGGSATSTDTLPPAPTPPPTPTPTPEPTDSGNGRTGTSTDTLPPPLPRTIPTEPEREYNPAADHPEIYANAEYGMAATCRTHDVDPETGNPQAATVTFDLGSYTGPVLLHLSIWRNGRYMAYETQGLASPGLERDGQRATLRVDTDPAQTRFRIDGRRHGLAANLLLGYANCDTDDP